MIPYEPNTSSSEADAGFTLVEALVAITLLSLLSLLVLGALRFGVTAWQRGGKVSDQIDEIVHAENFLRDMIAKASPYFIPRPGEKGYTEFDGRQNSLRFITDAPPAFNQAGQLIITFSSDQQNNQTDLIITSRPELAFADGNLAQLTRRTLVQNIAGVVFSYFGAKEPGEPREWHQEWSRETNLPELVRIDLEPKHDPPMPPIIIRPRLDVDLSCVYDTLTKRCRGR